MFNFFRKNVTKEEDKPQKKMASIDLFVEENSETVIVDITLDSYELEAIDSLSKIVKTCMHKEFSHNLLRIIYNNLEANDQHEVMQDLLDLLSESEIVSSSNEDSKSPVIKPSNMEF